MGVEKKEGRQPENVPTQVILITDRQVGVLLTQPADSTENRSMGGRLESRVGMGKIKAALMVTIKSRN